MKRIKRLFAIFMMLWGSIAQADGGWEMLLSWVGKYPSEQIGGRGSVLLGQTPIKDGLRKLLPKAEIQTLAKFAVEAPVRKVGDYLVVNKCLPHNCPSDMAVLVIDVKNEKLWAGFFSREEGRVSTRWYGASDDYSVLPDEIKKDFLSRHGD